MIEDVEPNGCVSHSHSDTIFICIPPQEYTRRQNYMGELSISSLVYQGYYESNSIKASFIINDWD